jgi:hypothetical protein
VWLHTAFPVGPFDSQPLFFTVMSVSWRSLFMSFDVQPYFGGVGLAFGPLHHGPDW